MTARSGRLARIAWLLPNEREPYKITTAWPVGRVQTCIRCGGQIMPAGRGQWAPLLVSVRDRGTTYRHRTTVGIHTGCVPTRSHASVRRGEWTKAKARLMFIGAALMGRGVR